MPIDAWSVEEKRVGPNIVRGVPAASRYQCIKEDAVLTSIAVITARRKSLESVVWSAKI